MGQKFDTAPSLTEQLASWIMERRAKGFGNHAIEQARYYVTDWLSSALAGGKTQPGQAMLAYAQNQPLGPCRIVGSSLERAAETAALLNGGLSHIVEMDDLDRRSVVHPATVVIPPAVAIAEREGASGLDFLNAVVAGYEVAIRVGEAVGKRHYYYFHNTATCGVFGAAAAAGWLLGLNHEQLVWALGNAGSQAAGLWQFNTDGDMTKHLHAGMAGANGIRAAELAACGLTGARHILEGERGFFKATAPDAQPEVVVEGLGNEQLKIATVSIKPHASCRHTHPAVDAALDLRKQLGTKDIDRCTVQTYQAAIDLCDNAQPTTPYAAKFSLQYCVASALIRGSAGLADFTPTELERTDIRSLLPNIKIELDDALEAKYPQQWPAEVSVQLSDGSRLSTEVDYPKGDPENALSVAELESKFCDLAQFADIDPEPWLDWIYALETAERTTLAY